MTVALDGSALTIEQVAVVARDRVGVTLDPSARTRIERARAVVESFSTGDVPVYGLTTGLGHRATLALDAHARADFQRRIILGRAVAIGEPLPTEVVRAAMLVRASCIAAGGSGASIAVPDLLIAMLNGGVHPIVGDTASIASADLGILASLALPLIGLGEVAIDAERLVATEGLRRIGQAPIALAGRDGLALCSSNAVSAGTAALALHDAFRLLDSACAAAALSLEAFVANLSPFDDRTLRARPSAGQVAVGARITALLAGSPLFTPGVARRVQDPISFRCTPPVFGAALAALQHAREAVEVELAAASDNPLVLVDDGEMLSTGNFHSAALALALEGACLGLAQLGWLVSQRVQRFLDPAASGLPGSLSPIGGDRAGLGVLGLPLTQIHAELRHLALPAALDTPAVAAGIEDHAGGALLPARKLARMVDRLHRVVAVELVVASQALDLRAPADVAPLVRDLRDRVRETVAYLDDDRPLGAEVERLAGRVATGEFAVRR